MQNSVLDASTAVPELSDEQVVARVLAGETSLFEIIVRRYNQRLYRATRAILRNDAQAEDAVQDAYLRAYQHLAQLSRQAAFAGWLLRIAVNEGLMRLRSRRHPVSFDAGSDDDGDPIDKFASSLPGPEQQASNAEFRRLLEQSIEALSEAHRTVFVLRDVEELSTPETAEALRISESSVKIRLHRARAMLRRKLCSYAAMETREAFGFASMRCDRLVWSVLGAIGKQHVGGQHFGTIVH